MSRSLRSATLLLVGASVGARAASVASPTVVQTECVLLIVDQSYELACTDAVPEAQARGVLSFDPQSTRGRG